MKLQQLKVFGNTSSRFKFRNVAMNRAMKLQTRKDEIKTLDAGTIYFFIFHLPGAGAAFPSPVPLDESAGAAAAPKLNPEAAGAAVLLSDVAVDEAAAPPKAKPAGAGAGVLAPEPPNEKPPPPGAGAGVLPPEPPNEKPPPPGAGDGALKLKAIVNQAEAVKM